MGKFSKLGAFVAQEHRMSVQAVARRFVHFCVSSARLYWENKLAFFDPKYVAISVAVGAFPDELYQVPRSWAERAFLKLIHYNKLNKGGHFAAWEQPELLTAELRTAFRSTHRIAPFDGLEER
jgi:hypothetical protein